MASSTAPLPQVVARSPLRGDGTAPVIIGAWPVLRALHPFGVEPPTFRFQEEAEEGSVDSELRTLPLRAPSDRSDDLPKSGNLAPVNSRISAA
jgi:hypothetical protein